MSYEVRLVFVIKNHKSAKIYQQIREVFGEKVQVMEWRENELENCQSF